MTSPPPGAASDLPEVADGSRRSRGVVGEVTSVCEWGRIALSRGPLEGRVAFWVGRMRSAAEGLGLAAASPGLEPNACPPSVLQAAATMGRRTGIWHGCGMWSPIACRPSSSSAFPHYFSKGIPNVLPRRTRACILRVAPRECPGRWRARLPSTEGVEGPLSEHSAYKHAFSFSSPECRWTDNVLPILQIRELGHREMIGSRSLVWFQCLPLRSPLPTSFLAVSCFVLKVQQIVMIVGAFDFAKTHRSVHFKMVERWSLCYVNLTSVLKHFKMCNRGAIGKIGHCSVFLDKPFLLHSWKMSL